ncbi:hypothetical protein ACFVYG_22465 [Streptomyces sp. NPDC058256]|uniref:hypothetical protein n=1 Tax=Streptomyces sp. NPDC058256 TaxID=3346408 RepID=UPI0036E63F0E
MPNSSTATPTDMQVTKFHPGHSTILEPLDEPCSLACTCGGLLEVKPDTKSAQLARFEDHLEQTRREDTAS